MTEDQATSLREKLLALRVRLLDHAVRQPEVDPLSSGWLSMVANVQAVLKAIEETARQPIEDYCRRQRIAAVHPETEGKSNEN